MAGRAFDVVVWGERRKLLIEARSCHTCASVPLHNRLGRKGVQTGAQTGAQLGPPPLQDAPTFAPALTNVAVALPLDLRWLQVPRVSQAGWLRNTLPAITKPA